MIVALFTTVLIDSMILVNHSNQTFTQEYKVQFPKSFRFGAREFSSYVRVDIRATAYSGKNTKQRCQARLEFYCSLVECVVK